MRFVMLGAGAIGGVVGGQLAKAGFDVLFVDPLREHVDAINRHGLHLRGVHGHHVLRVPAVTDVSAASLRGDDVVICSVKSYDMDAAMQALRKTTAHEVPVFCAQNGIRNEEVAARYFRNVHGVMVLIGAKRLVPGEVVHTSAGPLGVGRWPSGLSEAAREVTQAIAKTDIPAYATEEIAVHKWNKMAINLNNATFGLLGISGQEAQADPEVRAFLADVYEEGVRVLRGGRHPVRRSAGQLDRGPDPEPARTHDGSVTVPADEEPRHRPSLWQDLHHGGGQVEADWFNGEIVRLGRAHGVPTPYSALLLELITEMAAASRAPGTLHAAGPARPAPGIGARHVARPNRLREKLAAGRTCVGPLFQEFWSPELFEFCALAGFDFLIADGEHAGVDPQAVRNLARAAQGAGATALLRVPNGEASLVLRYLDAGVEGLILPHCNSAADAESFVRASRYPPARHPGRGELEPGGGVRLHPDAARASRAVGSRGALPRPDRGAAGGRGLAGDPPRRRARRLLRRRGGHGAHPRPPVLRRGDDAPGGAAAGRSRDRPHPGGREGRHVPGGDRRRGARHEPAGGPPDHHELRGPGPAGDRGVPGGAPGRRPIGSESRGTLPVGPAVWYINRGRGRSPTDQPPVEGSNGVRDPRPAHSVPGRRGRPRALPGPPHLLRGPELRGARARDGSRSRPRAAILLHEAGGRPGDGRRGLCLSVPQRGRPPRAGAGRRPGPGRGRHPGRAGARARVRLRRGARHDPARSPGRGEEDGAPVGRRQGVRRVGALHGHPPGRGDRPSGQGRRLARGERRSSGSAATWPS